MNLFENLFEPEREETTGEIVFFKLFELFVAAGTLYLAWTWGPYVQRISDVVLPLGIAQYLDVSFMFGNALPLLNAALISGLVVLGFFRVSRVAYLAAFLLLHLQYAARYSLGEIPHSSNMLGMTLLGLALATLVFQEARYRRRFTLGFTYFFVGLGYTLSAFCKLIATGLSWPDGRHLWLWIHEKSVDALSKTGAIDLNLLQELALSDHTIATAFLAVGLLTELCAWLMWWRRFRTPVVVAVIGLHLGIYLVMNILFYLSVIELLLLGFPWAAALDRFLQYRPAASLLSPLKRVSLRFA